MDEKELKEIEKEVVEMAKDYDEIRTQSHKDYIPQSNMGIANYFARAFVEKGYHKLPDGTIVLLVGKENQALDEKTIEYFVKHNEQVRKQAAKNYYDKMAQEIESHNFETSTDYEHMNVCNKEILKECGVEVDE